MKTKKIKTGLFIGLCATIMAVPFFSGCDVSTRYKDLHTEISNFISDSAYTQFFNSKIEFSTTIENAIQDQSSPYHIIDYYQNIVGVSLANVTYFYNSFEIKPLYNTDSTKKLCDDTINKISDFKNQVTSFNIKKASLETEVSEMGLTQAVAELELFEKDLGKLTEKANSLQISFVNTYSTLYCQDIVRESAGSKSDVQSSVLKIESNLINDYVKFAILENKYIHPKTPSTLYSSIKTLSSQLKLEAITENYSSWLNIYKLFANEETMFNTSLNKVDLQNQEEKTYTGENKQYQLKVNNFVNHNAPRFVNKTITLLYNSTALQ